ncbi:uncharacterized protein LOC135462043 [Liolophura sinensis]|uniref:uncharacterized protein LOC135462043 n=1 Tax=Liolophura sinensis TaxID=3198878 RepID=UPI003158E8F3
MTSTDLPVVDFSMLNIANVRASEAPPLRESDKLKPLADNLVEALEEFGCCYLKNHGISLEKAKHLFDVTREVFSLPEEIKNKYAQRDNAILHGYVTREIERSKQVNSVERYETFMVCPRQADDLWADEVAEFKPAALGVYYELQELSKRVFDVLGVGLGLKDRGYIRRYHMDDFGEIRDALYHRYPDDFVPQPGQVRFHPHYDIGTVNLIYQDSAGGLEIKKESGEWMAVPYIPGTVIMLVGKLMQRWTSDRLKAPFHRVSIPVDLAPRRTDRQSLTYFPAMADDFEVRCLDGSDKYKPVTFQNYTYKIIYGAKLTGALDYQIDEKTEETCP